MDMYDDDFQKMRAEANAWARGRERKFLEDWCAEAGLKEPVAYDYRYHEGFTIYTNRPGVLIGKSGTLSAKYRARLKEEFCKSNDIKIVEIRSGFANYENKKIEKNKKTLWQKIYSFFGFWSYYVLHADGSKHRIFYWCCLPWGKFFRKFDLFKIKC